MCVQSWRVIDVGWRSGDVLIFSVEYSKDGGRGVRHWSRRVIWEGPVPNGHY